MTDTSPQAGQRAAADDGWPPRRILLIGYGRLVEVARRALDDVRAEVVDLREPADRQIRRAMSQKIDAVIVISRDDRVALRQALVVEGLQPGVRLIVTIYNRDLGAQLRRAVRNARVMSMADIVAPSLAGACLGDDLLSVRRTDGRVFGIRSGEEGPVSAPLALHRPNLGERLLANVVSLLRPFELSARTLLAGLLGFLLILVADTAVVSLALHESVVEAVYAATKTIVTVGPSAQIDHGPAWLKLFSAGTMLAALAFTAIFTAGLIDRLLDRRLVGILGSRAMPHKHHVVVVGLGQVGLRLCLMLRLLDVPVVAVEAASDGANIRRAKQYNIPVVIGRGNSRGVLRRLSLSRARAIAAVTSDEVENVSTVMAALAICANLRTVLRAGSGHVLDETRALFRVGAVRDVYRIGGTLLAAAALGSAADYVFTADDEVWIVGEGGRIERFEEHVRMLEIPGAADDGAGTAPIASSGRVTGDGSAKDPTRAEDPSPGTVS